ncbi:GtrA family protein [Pseudomonas reactans]|uniref:GtrA family protein n=1 Tax=Pseudomonas reactans TaxID=117680 RepID=UPI0015A2CEF9|nr:GtrA family protein [Pseudomonas reactans]NWC85304.1 GtrA family protein [Pseudomonas reactans]NWD31770.1 GtrA family protein [Pseudomonas reactans]NWF15161.1 GtrA family protein [Pseudomonas reactans]
MTFVRYGTIQVLAYALDMGTFLLLLCLFSDHAVLANIAGKGVAGVFAFFLHRHFTFQSTGSSGKVQALRYFSLLAINIPVASALLGIGLFFVDNPTPVKFASDVVCVLMTYWISKLFVFRSKQYDPAPSDHMQGQ